MTDLVPLGQTGLVTSRLGLGCSHIASLSTRPDARAIASLLEAAWDGGIRYFDTADIYGQGDSERRLANIARRPGAVICTKAGLTLRASQTLVRLAKPVLRPMLHLLPVARKAAANARARSQHHDLDPARITRRLESSLRRLGIDQVGVFLLHSPPVNALQDGVLFDLLDQLRQRGLVHSTGISCQTLDDAHWVLAQNRAQVLQIPLQAAQLGQAAPLLAAAWTSRTAIVAREVLAGANDPAAALRPLLADSRIAVTLTGTTSARHLAQNLSVAREG